MNQRKLFPIIAGGYRTRIKKSLLSKMYPRYIDEKLVMNEYEILSGTFYEPTTIEDELTVTYSVLSGDITQLAEEMPIIDEGVTVSNSTIISGVLRGVVYTIPLQSDSVVMSSSSITSGDLTTVLITVTQPYELITMGNPQVLSGTLV